MKIFLNYLNKFRCISLAINNKEVTNTETKNNIVTLYNYDEVIGYNILNIDLNDVENKLENKELQKLTKELLKNNGIDINFEDQFIVVKVIDCENIPNTHLSNCKVFDGKEYLQIVCGARNVRKEMFTVLATIGSWLPNGMQIKKGKLAGIDSFGMLCSKKELNINSPKINDEGIIDLTLSENNVGKSVWEII
ncbi:putative tRNA-binding protein [Spiroplasma corruscae]|uniref:Putative tRNA-binding protein n=1 Tax=Spiroplasma corruscae TaxID=216934 RepID=A0A222EN65_9MOLU|nr:hypothetical protein [Spiroplasma corruscae]ASP27918.1 putative tRNA-binding protein [Spiroplasma corruscae]